MLVHPDYITTPPTNDICLLYLETHFDLSEGTDAEPIELAETNPGIGKACNISGWGTLEVKIA